MKYVQALLTLLLILSSCTAVPLREDVVIRAVQGLPTRAIHPDEERIQDLNILIFNESGILEEKRFIPRRQLERDPDGVLVRTRLLMESRYDIYLCANLGYALPVQSEDELFAYRYHLAYPDELLGGIPMTGCLRKARPAEADGELNVPLERMMARVTLRLDRSALDGDVRMTVRRVTVGACPSSALLFGESRAENVDQIFLNGYALNEEDTAPLNRESAEGMSREADLYLLENLQGDDSTARCSYIELEMEYYSDSWHTAPGEYLKYRFFPCEDEGSYDIRRNTLYRYTVRPEGDGLGSGGWRVDRSALDGNDDVYFDLHPAAYNEMNGKGTFHLWCDVSPKRTAMEIEPIAYDDSESVSAVYDYQIDADGKGLTLTPRKGGTALIYFKAGEPVNRDTLALVVFNL